MGNIISTLVMFFISISIIVLFSYFIYIKIDSIYRDKQKQYYIKNFKDYMASFEYLCEKCYEMIYKNQILIYSLEGFKLDEQDFKKTVTSFINFFYRYCGPILIQSYIDFFGNDETLNFTLVEFFNSKTDNDLIFEKSMETSIEKSMDEV